MARGRPREFDTDKALDAALLLFWHHGYEGTSMSMLAKAMRISMPSLYAAFGSKEMLFQRALERYLQRPASYLPKALRERSARRAIKMLFRGAIDMVMDPKHPDGCLLVHGALASGPDSAAIRAQLAAARRMAEDAIRKRLTQAITDGELPHGTNAASLARYFATVLWGMSVQAAGGATRAQLAQTAKLAMRAWPDAPHGKSNRNSLPRKPSAVTNS